MKKALLSMLILGSISCLHSQIIQTENFNSLPIGNVGTDITAMIPSNNYLTLSTNYDLDPLAVTTGTNASNSNFQIVANDLNHDKVLQVEGSNGDKGRRNMWLNEFPSQWGFRDTGNDIIEVEFDLYTGTSGGASANTKGLYVYDASTTSLKILTGFVFNTKTLVISGIAYFTNATTPINNYLFFLGTGGTNLTLEPNVWVRLGASFNKTTGQVRWKGPTFNGQTTGAAIGIDPDRVAFISRSGSAVATATAPAIINNASTIGLFDNLIVRATATDTLLAVEEITDSNSNFSVYPNPVTNLISVSSKNNAAITAVSLTDLNGRIIKNQSFDTVATIEMNVSDLASGMYLMTIVSNEGTATKKIVKN